MLEYENTKYNTQWEKIKEQNIKKHTKPNLENRKTCRGIRRVLKFNNFIKHSMRLYRERTTKGFLWTLVVHYVRKTHDK